MRFISMHKSTPDMEAGVPPSEKLLEGIGPLMGEMIQNRILLEGEGLRPSSTGVRVRVANGKRTVTRGPFTGANELTDRYLIVRVPSLDDAIEWGARFVGNDGEVDVRPVTEPWDFGAPKPEGLTGTRFMILQKSDARTEAGSRRAEGEVTGRGELLSRETLQPSSKGVRLRFRGGKRTVIDGPFAESKELVAGFVIVDVPSKEDAMHYATKFADLIGDIEIDIRPLY